MRRYRRFSPARIRMRLGIVRTVGEVAPTLRSSFVLAPREHVQSDSAARANMCPARRCVAVTIKRWRPVAGAAARCFQDEANDLHGAQYLVVFVAGEDNTEPRSEIAIWSSRSSAAKAPSPWGGGCCGR